MDHVFANTLSAGVSFEECRSGTKQYSASTDKKRLYEKAYVSPRTILQTQRIVARVKLTGENSLLGPNRGRILNALIASVFVTIGFSLVWNPIPVSGAFESVAGFIAVFLWAIVAILGFAALLLWVGTTAPHVWAWACLFLGIESLSWPIVQFGKLQMGGASLSEEQLIAVTGNAFLGVFFATFWLTFAYGIFRWIRRTDSAGVTPPNS